MPVRFGGLGIADPTKASFEYIASTTITANLTKIIFNQEEDFKNYNNDQVNKNIAEIKSLKESRLKEEFEEIYKLVDNKMKRILKPMSGKGLRGVAFHSTNIISRIYPEQTGIQR